jgi:hypothetical protein
MHSSLPSYIFLIFADIKLDGYGAVEIPAVRKDEIEAASSKKERSVLQAKLTRLAIQIGYAGSAVAASTVLILIIRFCIEYDHKLLINN